MNPVLRKKPIILKTRRLRLPTIEAILNMGYGDGPRLYYFGSTLSGFTLERHLDILGEMMRKAPKWRI